MDKSPRELRSGTVSVSETALEILASQKTTAKMAEWKTYKTDDGKEYYHNEKTNETTWTKPKELEEPKANGNGAPLGENEVRAPDGSVWTKYEGGVGCYIACEWGVYFASLWSSE